MLWTPPRQWEGQDAYLIGGGASLRSFDFNQLIGRNTIGSNDAFRLGNAIIQICLFGDASWFHRTKFELEKFGNPIVTCAPSLMTLNTPMLKHMKRAREGLAKGSNLGWNFSTGASAINLAISLGAKRIFLLGYDMCLVNEKSHWHDHRPHVTREAIFQRFIKGFKCISEHLVNYDVEVIHVMDGVSRLPFFRQMTFAQFAEHLAKPMNAVEERELEYCI